MRAVPIPDGVAEAMGGQRIVLGDDDPTRDDVRPCEYILTASKIYPGRPCVHALVELDPEDRARLAAGARVWLTMDGGEWPWALTVEEVEEPPAPPAEVPVSWRPRRIRGRLCEHAQQRAAEMGVPEAEVLEVLTGPEVDAPTDIRGHGDRDRRLASGGRLTVPYFVDDTGCRVAVTVLWRGMDHR